MKPETYQALMNYARKAGMREGETFRGWVDSHRRYAENEWGVLLNSLADEIDDSVPYNPYAAYVLPRLQEYKMFTGPVGIEQCTPQNRCKSCRTVMAASVARAKERSVSVAALSLGEQRKAAEVAKIDAGWKGADSLPHDSDWD